MNRQLIQDAIQWDVRTWSRALRYWERAVPWDAVRGPCLEIGSREGGLSLWLALKGLDVVCSDVADAERRARALHEKYGVSSSVTYRDIDATDIPYENHFDIVCFKSVLGAVGYDDRRDRQQRAVEQMYKALKPGGMLLFAENLKATPIHGWLRNHLVGGYARRWRYISMKEMRSFVQSFSTCDMRSTGLISLFGRTESQRNLLGIVDRLSLNWLVPPAWRYMVYGIATKDVA